MPISSLSIFFIIPSNFTSTISFQQKIFCKTHQWSLTAKLNFIHILLYLPAVFHLYLILSLLKLFPALFSLFHSLPTVLLLFLWWNFLSLLKIFLILYLLLKYWWHSVFIILTPTLNFRKVISYIHRLGYKDSYFTVS